MDMHERMAFEF